MDHSLAAFLAISAVVIVTPGQDTALTIRNTLLGGRRAGVATAIGVAAGQLVWTIAAAAGITALLVASEPVFAAVRLAGAAYLVYLGATTIRAGVRGSSAHDVRPSASRRPALRQGLFSNLGNPKMVIFFSSLLPQFVPVDGPAFGAMLGLGVLFCAMTLTWLAGYAVVVARAGGVLGRPRVRRTIDAVTGTILVAFGIRLAAEPA
ncbi:MAG TPA: LysE family translocator [Candidatus Limnocylindrales bacterium]|jgi:threonine/homoserine/homoserine lactone efflux protein